MPCMAPAIWDLLVPYRPNVISVCFFLRHLLTFPSVSMMPHSPVCGLCVSIVWHMPTACVLHVCSVFWDSPTFPLPLLPSPVFAHVCGQALERQKEYFDCIRKERDELRDELADIKGKAKSAEVGICYDWPLEGSNVSTQWHSVFCLKIGQLGLH